ncbi:putative ribonuclease H-like domain-containing protein [Tanacetum coccineum]
MAFSDSEVHNDKPCTKSCLKNYETLKKQYDDLLAKLHESVFKAATYKRGLATVEAQLVTYRKNEVLFSEEVAVLKREVGCKQYEINVLKTEFEKLKQEKDAIDFKIEKFGKASKDLDQLLGSQITDKSKKGFGYSAVPPPHPLIYNRPNKLDLSYSGLDEFKEPEFKGHGHENSKKESNVVCENQSDNSDKSLQIHEDDLEAMDLKWQISLLSVRVKKYYQKTRNKIFINGNDIAGYDKSKVECYNCHKLGYFARECRAPRSKEDRFRNHDNTRKQGNKEDTSKAMLAINGVGFDWSDMAKEQVQTNMALMAFSDSEIYTR